MPPTSVRRMVPSSVMSISSSSSRPTSRMADTSPVSLFRELAMTPPVARCLTGKSSTSVRLPNPCSVTTSSSSSRFWTTSMPMTSSSPLSRMAVTPIVSRPIGRTSDSLKRAAWPFRVATMTSLSPSERPTHCSSSPPCRLMAIRPLARIFAYSASEVFLIIPRRVAMTRKWSGSNCGRLMMALTYSRCSTWTPGRLMDGILLPGQHGQLPAAAAALRAEGADRLALDVAALAERDHHVLGGDQVLGRQLAVRLGLDARLPVVAVALLQVGQLVLDDRQDLARVGQQVLQLGDELDDAAVLVLDLLALEGGEPAELHLQDGVRLHLGQPEARDERLPRHLHVGRRADGGDHLVQVVEGDLEALEDVGPLLGARQVELRPATHDLAAVGDVVLARILQAQRLGLAVDEREHVGAEAGLQLRVLEELLHDRVRGAVALHLDHDPHAVSVAFVANVANVGDLLGAHQVRHLLDQRRLVHLVRQLGDHHRHAAGTDLLEGDLAADDDPPAPGGVHVADRVDALLLARQRVALLLVA